MNFLETISKREFDDFEETINYLIEDELKDNPNLFMKEDLYEYISFILYELFSLQWSEMEIYDPDEDEDDTLYHSIFILVISFFYNNKEYPMRSELEINEERVEDVNHIKEQLEILSDIIQPEQRTTEWYDIRNNLLTASNMYKVFGSEASRNSLIYEKCNSDALNRKIMSYSLAWGNTFEPLSIKIYEKKFNTKIQEFGCIRHNNIQCIGASPDGINVEPSSPRYGRMLEVKNVFNRIITGIPKLEYWTQMQIQMETCNLEICDFLETAFKEFEIVDDIYTSSYEWNGIIAHFYNSDNPYHIEYYPLENELTPENVEKWKTMILEKMERDGMIFKKFTGWYLQTFSCVKVKRNRFWFSQSKQKIIDVWNTILLERNSDFSHRAPKRRKINESNDSQNSQKAFVVQTDNNDVRTLHNIVTTNTINLVKML